MPKPGPRTTYRYSSDFKATAIRLSQLLGVAVQDVAASLYIHPFMLSRWRKQAREGMIMAKGVVVDKEVAAELKDVGKVSRADFMTMRIAALALAKSFDAQALPGWCGTIVD
jgi:transposase